MQESRSSLSSVLDWDDKDGLLQYCAKQKRIGEQNGFRPSDYFGAIKVDKLEDGIDDSRIDGMKNVFFLFKFRVIRGLLRSEA
jgi:hypothetical protein